MSPRRPAASGAPAPSAPGTSGRRVGSLRRRLRTRPAATALALAALGLGTLAAGLASTPTDAAFHTQETGQLVVTAGRVEPPAAQCRIVDQAVAGVGGSHQLEITPPATGLPVTGYLVDISAKDHAGSTAKPANWKTSDSSGEPFLGYGQNHVDAAPGGGAVHLRWGISAGWNAGWDGTVTVRAVGPGGWQSEPVTRTWAIWFTVLGDGHGTC